MKDIYVKDIIREKGAKVWTIRSNATAFEALEKMADKDIGAVVVTEGDGFRAEGRGLGHRVGLCLASLAALD